MFSKETTSHSSPLSTLRMLAKSPALLTLRLGQSGLHWGFKSILRLSLSHDYSRCCWVFRDWVGIGRCSTLNRRCTCWVLKGRMHCSSFVILTLPYCCHSGHFVEEAPSPSSRLDHNGTSVWWVQQGHGQHVIYISFWTSRVFIFYRSNLYWIFHSEQRNIGVHRINKSLSPIGPGIDIKRHGMDKIIIIAK